MRSFSRFVNATVLAFAVLSLTAIRTRGAAILIQNPSFEANDTGGVAGALTGWTSSNSSLTGNMPFSDANADGDFNAFITNTGITTSLSQTVSGLAVGKTCELDVLLKAPATGMLISYGGQTIGGSSAAGTNPRMLAFSIGFLPATSSGTLSFSNVSPGKTLQIDAVSMRNVLVNEHGHSSLNCSFEGCDSTDPNGYSRHLGSWDSTGVVGVNPNVGGASAFADNGAIPDGQRVAFLKATPGADASISSFPSVYPGGTFELSFRYNASSGGGGLDPAVMDVSVGSVVLASDVVVNPVGGDQPYYIFDQTFTATNPPVIRITSRHPGATGESVLLVDNVIVTPEPGVGLAMLGLICCHAGRRRRRQ